MKFRNMFVLLLTMMLFAGIVSASEDSLKHGWNTGLIFDLTTTQANYSDSWVGGEAGSFNWVSNLNGSAERQLSPKFNYKSTLKLSFGQTHSQDQETKSWSKPAKSTDLIDWENVGRFTMGGFVDPYVAFRVESQFLDASDPDTNRYLNPMKLTESAGIAKMLYKKDEKNTVLSRLGFALKQNMNKAFDKNTNDGGLESVTDVNMVLSEKMKYTGKLSLYKAFFFSAKDDFANTEYADDWKAIDVNWENIINATITKIVSVNFYTQLLYDKQITKKARIKETLGLGLVVKLK